MRSAPRPRRRRLHVPAAASPRLVSSDGSRGRGVGRDRISLSKQPFPIIFAASDGWGRPPAGANPAGEARDVRSDGARSCAAVAKRVSPSCAKTATPRMPPVWPRSCDSEHSGMTRLCEQPIFAWVLCVPPLFFDAALPPRVGRAVESELNANAAVFRSGCVAQRTSPLRLRQGVSMGVSRRFERARSDRDSSLGPHQAPRLRRVTSDDRARPERGVDDGHAGRVFARRDGGRRRR